MTSLAVATFAAGEFDPEGLVRAKVGQGLRVSVCIPARNEESTVGEVVGAVVRDLVERLPLVDEVLVVDDGSTDATTERAAAAGARVVAADDVLPECGPGTGKGEALWKSLAASQGDLVVWCDADVRDFDARFVTGLLGPLLTRRSVAFVKGFYERPVEGRAGEGGRVTELVARPLIALLLPQLSQFVQPLAGEYAGRRSVLEQVPFVQGYGVDLALLADLADLVGLDAMAQVDLGERVHRNRPLAELSAQSVEVVRAALGRGGVALPPGPTVLSRPGHEPMAVDPGERPALGTVAGYRRRAG